MSTTTVPTVTSAVHASGLRVAGSDRRFYAFAIDRLVAWGVALAAGIVVQHDLIGRGPDPVGVLAVVATVLVVGGVFALMLGVTGSTPGKAFCGLSVIDVHTGRPIGAGRALLRTLVVGGATVPFGFGLAALARTALTDPAHLRRGRHDRLVSSVVVDLRPPPGTHAPEDPAPHAVVNLTAQRLVPAHPAPSLPEPDLATGVLRRTPVAGQQSLPAWGLVFDTGERLRVETPVLIGRRPQPRDGEQGARLVGLPSSDGSVSPTHVQVVVAPDGTLVVTDRGSTDGSVLRRRGVAKPLAAGRPATLLDGDVVHIGDRTMAVVRIG